MFLCLFCFLRLHSGLAEAVAYDHDRNLTQDGTFDYTWDAETLDAILGTVTYY